MSYKNPIVYAGGQTWVASYDPELHGHIIVQGGRRIAIPDTEIKALRDGITLILEQEQPK